MLSNYETISLLGKGAFGEVYKARRPDGKLIALKVIDTSKLTGQQFNDINNEVSTLTKLSTPECNPFVVCYYDSHYDSKNKQYLIEMEYIEGQEMLDFIKNRAMTDEEYYYYLLLIARDLSLGLSHAHKTGILHNDIKPENIMIQKNTYLPKLIDFGIACNVNKEDYCIKNGGTPYYFAPEFFYMKGGFKKPASDMWSLGATLYRAATKEFLWKVKSFAQLKYELINKQPPKLTTNNYLLNSVVNGLLKRDPNERLTPSQVAEMIDNNIVRPKSLIRYV